mmetsp:Transcript_46229/g.75632  ORF Transcript_46229/g.75632 Transcript_46229/m.75632 type:complete len:227 (+) Transcript_46229:248-928(+)
MPRRPTPGLKLLHRGRGRVRRGGRTSHVRATTCPQSAFGKDRTSAPLFIAPQNCGCAAGATAKTCSTGPSSCNDFCREHPQTGLECPRSLKCTGDTSNPRFQCPTPRAPALKRTPNLSLSRALTRRDSDVAGETSRSSMTGGSGGCDECRRCWAPSGEGGSRPNTPEICGIRLMHNPNPVTSADRGLQSFLYTSHKFLLRPGDSPWSVRGGGGGGGGCQPCMSWNI